MRQEMKVANHRQLLHLIFSMVSLFSIVKTASGFSVNNYVSKGRLRSFRSFCTSKETSLESESSKKKFVVVFLGTPDVAASCLTILQTAASKLDSTFNIAAVVTQPPAPAGRNKKLTASPVQITAEQLSIPIFSPEKAGDPIFLSALEALAPDLCITAAYGNYLPKKFLSISKFGTVNIHPSLLPKYRGAAPVQRCLEAGDAVSGVSLLYTVQKMDAGPLISQHQCVLSGDEKAPEFLTDMFSVGAQLLLDNLPSILSGEVKLTEQDETQATAADKLSPLDARTDFSCSSALQVHNKARGLAGWPGLWSTFLVTPESSSDSNSDTSSVSSSSGSGSDSSNSSNDSSCDSKKTETPEPQRIKIITTTVLEPASASTPPTDAVTVIKVNKKAILRVVCFDGSVLGISELQPPGKKVMDVRSFVNGLRGATLKWTVPPI